MKTEFHLTKKNQTLTIMPLGDIHYGSPNCNTNYFEFALNKFKNTPGEKILYLLGDECDIAVKRQGNSTYQQKIDVNEQLEYIIQSYQPYKEYINGIVQSNHMSRTKNELDLDISQIIEEQLDIPYTNNIYETLLINDQPYTIYATHGTRTSNQLHLMQGAMQRNTNHIEANLFLMGHCHYLNYWSQPRTNTDGYTRRHYLLTGHFLNYKGSYAEINGLRPNPCGFAKIHIDSNLRTNATLYHEDECKEMII